MDFCLITAQKYDFFGFPQTTPCIKKAASPSGRPLDVYYRKLFFREIGFVHAAERAAPIVGKIFKGGAGGNAVVGITDCGVIDITAHVTYVLFHNLMIFKGL
jgi:hypothetical protein